MPQPMQRPRPRLTRRITLLEPGPPGPPNDSGTIPPGDPIRHPVWADFQQLPGDEGLNYDTIVRRERLRYIVRGGPGGIGHRVNTSWQLEDLAISSAPSKIESAVEMTNTPVRGQYYRIRCLSLHAG